MLTCHTAARKRTSLLATDEAFCKKGLAGEGLFIAFPLPLLQTLAGPEGQAVLAAAAKRERAVGCGFLSCLLGGGSGSACLSSCCTFFFVRVGQDWEHPTGGALSSVRAPLLLRVPSQRGRRLPASRK